MKVEGAEFCLKRQDGHRVFVGFGGSSDRKERRKVVVHCTFSDTQTTWTESEGTRSSLYLPNKSNALDWARRYVKDLKESKVSA